MSPEQQRSQQPPQQLAARILVLHRDGCHAEGEAAGEQRQRLDEGRPDAVFARGGWSTDSGGQHHPVSGKEQGEDHRVAHQKYPESEQGGFGLIIRFASDRAQIEAGVPGFAGLGCGFAHAGTLARPSFAEVISISRKIGVAAATASSQRRWRRSTSAAGTIRLTSRAKLRAITAATIPTSPTTASHHICQTKPNASAAPSTPMTGPVALFRGTSISS